MGGWVDGWMGGWDSKQCGDDIDGIHDPRRIGGDNVVSA